MQTTQIVRLPYLPLETFQRLQACNLESGKVWNICKQAHRICRKNYLPWPTLTNLQTLTKGACELHSQSIQLVCRAFIANIDSTRENRIHGLKGIKYPWRDKKFYPTYWHGQAIKHEKGKTILPMGRGRKPIIIPVEIDKNCTVVRLVWNRGFELHVSKEVQKDTPPTGNCKATFDLGEIHLAAVTADNGKGLIISGRGIRSAKRLRSKRLGQITKLQARCKKGSRRWKKLQRAKNKVILRTERRVRDLRHKAAREIINFCKTQGVTEIYIGNPHGVRKKDCGRHHNQRMALWEYGRDIQYLTYKAKLAGIKVKTGTERGTSSTCPECGHKHKPSGREWVCPSCGFRGHRDLVGAANMHPLAFEQKVKVPTQAQTTYLRPGLTRRSSSAVTRQSELTKQSSQPPRNGVSSETRPIESVG